MVRATFLAAAAAVLASPARAEPTSITIAYSPYEEQAIADAEVALGTRVDPHPVGKRVQRIDFVRLDPIDRHDPAPMALDAVHVTSRPSVLRRELLVSEGDRWDPVFVDESARNLRASPQLSLVLCVPMRGSTSDAVRLVVITKDVWSLYVDFDVEATGQGFTSLTLEPKETNVAGLQHTVVGRLVLQPATYALGASYQVPRLGGRWLALSLDGNVIVNRASGEVEGSHGSATVQQPLYSSLAPWAWSTGVTWDDEIFRLYEGTMVKSFVDAATRGSVPWMYRSRSISEQAQLTRSLGWETKDDLSLGMSLSHNVYRVPQYPASTSATVTDFVRAEMPVGEDRVGPFAQSHWYTSDFLRILDLDTLGLQEDVRLGREAWLRVYPVLRALGSTHDLIGAYAAVAYTMGLGDGLAKASLEATTEGEQGRVANANLTAAFAAATPRTGVGRLFFGTTLVDRWRNDLNSKSYLGGDSRLRGYPPNAFAGSDLIAANLEYRSRPVEVAAIQLGAVAFYDAGDAFETFGDFRPKHSLGFGVRAVFPQIERIVLRVDVGFPVHATPDVAPMGVFVAFHQAVSIPAIGAGFGP